MSIENLQNFFFWCLIINCIIYLISVIAVLFMRDFLCNMHEKLFALEKATVLKALYAYLATYKLLLIVFNLTPWVALLLID